MANVIQVKRGVVANVGALTLAAGEPAFVTDTGELYVGDGTTKVLINPPGMASETYVDSALTDLATDIDIQLSSLDIDGGTF